MSLLNAEVVIRTKYIGRNNRRKQTTMLLIVSMVQDVNHSLGIGVAQMGGVGRSIVNHGLINGICCFIRENARRQTGDDLLNSHVIRRM